jgi:hypothetical protein
MTTKAKSEKLRYWITEVGKKILLTDLTDSHLSNIIKHIQDRMKVGCGLSYPAFTEQQEGELLQIMTNEKSRRFGYEQGKKDQAKADAPQVIDYYKKIKEVIEERVRKQTLKEVIEEWNELSRRDWESEDQFFDAFEVRLKRRLKEVSEPSGSDLEQKLKFESSRKSDSELKAME